MEETKKLLIYAAIAVVLLLVSVTVFVFQAREIAQGFFSSLDQPEEEQETIESVEFKVDYVSADASFEDNLKYILINFDPLGRFVHCNVHDSYYDDDSDDVYTIECDPIVFDLRPEETDYLTVEHLYGKFFDIFQDRSWKPASFSGMSMIYDGPRKLAISANEMNFENGCRSDHIFDDNTLGRIFVYQDATGITVTSPSEYKMMMTVYFKVDEPAGEFNPAVAFCTNIGRS